MKWLQSAFLGSAAVSGTALPASMEPDRRPNIVLVLSDDQGMGDFSAAGHGALETPHLDRLAAECPKIARFYVSPVCSATRASLMTGRYNYRTRVVDTWAGRSMMEPDEVTLAELLQGAGYRTGIFGKWHLGDCYPLRPMEQGFDVSLVHRGGGLAQPSEPPANDRRYTDPILFENGVEVATEGYCTDVYFDAALAFIDASLASERPFFAYVATNAPHDPFHDVPRELYAKYAERDMKTALRGKSDEVDREARICAMVENIDRNVGRLLARLDARGIAKDTIVVYFNDNGPLRGRYTAGLRGAKTGVHEGGIRSPLFVRWTRRLSPSTEVDPIAAHIDLLPTLLEAAGVPVPGDLRLDGRSLLPLLRGARTTWPERRLFLQAHRGDAPAFEHHFAVVEQRWKLVRASGFGKHRAEGDERFELFDLEADREESNDLSTDEPEIVAALRAAYGEWFADVSNTRPDNYAPPRIVVGEAAERKTVLTLQDSRLRAGEAWGRDGLWHLETRAPRAVAVTLLFREPTTLDAVRLRVGDRVVERSVGETGRTLPLGLLELPGGAFDLGVKCSGGGKPLAVHQVVLDTRAERD